MKLGYKKYLIFILTIVVLIEVAFIYFSEIHKSEKSVNNHAKIIVQKCKNDSPFNLCYTTEMASFNKSNNLEFTLSVLKKVQDIDPLAKQCHLIAHRIANSEVDKNPDRWLDVVLKTKMNYCEYGFLHGAIEARAKHNGGSELNSVIINETCQEILEISNDFESDQACAHILGHFILVNNNGDIQKASDICRNVKENLTYQCFNGMFMEQVFKTNLYEHKIISKLPILSEDAFQKHLELCKKYDGFSAHACWSISAAFIITQSFEPEKMWNICSNAPSNYIYNCYLSGAGNLIKLPLNKQQKSQLCERFISDETKFNECILTMVKSLLYTNTTLLSKAIDYCANNIPASYKKKCYEITAKYLKLYSNKNEISMLCGAAPADFRQYCST